MREAARHGRAVVPRRVSALCMSWAIGQLMCALLASPILINRVSRNGMQLAAVARQ